MLGWFKKKFAKKDRQEEPVVEKAAEAVEPLEVIDVVESIETIDAEEVVEAVRTEPVPEPDEVEGFESEPVAVEKSAEAVEAAETVEIIETIEAEKFVEAVKTEPVPEPDDLEESEPKSVAAVESAPAEDSVAVLEADAIQPLAEEPLVEEPVREKPSPDKPQVEQQKPQLPSMFKRLQDRLGKTRNTFVHRLDSLFLGKKKIDQELLDDLEEILITADSASRYRSAVTDAGRI